MTTSDRNMLIYEYIQSNFVENEKLNTNDIKKNTNVFLSMKNYDQVFITKPIIYSQVIKHSRDIKDLMLTCFQYDMLDKLMQGLKSLQKLRVSYDIFSRINFSKKYKFLQSLETIEIYNLNNNKDLQISLINKMQKLKKIIIKS